MSMIAEADGGFAQEFARRNRRIGTDYLAELACWRWWVTLTFKRYVPRDRARAAVKAFFRGIARDVFAEHVHVAWVFEPTKLGVFHAHALLAPTGERDVTARRLEHLWWGTDFLAGFARIVRYAPGGPRDPVVARANYLARKDEWNVTVVCHRPPPCRRKHGCRVMKGAWF